MVTRAPGNLQGDLELGRSVELDLLVDGQSRVRAGGGAAIVADVVVVVSPASESPPSPPIHPTAINPAWVGTVSTVVIRRRVTSTP